LASSAKLRFVLKRFAAAAMWFMSALWGWNYVSLISGAPSSLGLLIATSLAASIVVDPFSRFWPTRSASARAPLLGARDTLSSPTQPV
jgi:hypothetical protein